MALDNMLRKRVTLMLIVLIVSKYLKHVYRATKCVDSDSKVKNKK
jgi:hypothetical protein